MLRVTLRLLLITFATSGVSLALIHGQPYTMPQIAPLLAPTPNCGATLCWQGIRLGRTTLEEALALLAQHPWVGEITLQRDPRVYTNGTTIITWAWSGSQPGAIDTASPPAALVRSDRVIGVRVPTRLLVGDVLYQRGLPDSAYGNGIEHNLQYQELDSNLRSDYACPNFDAQLKAAVSIDLYGGMSFNGMVALPYFPANQPLVICERTF
ncbi:MAG: hypothetical protein GYB67_16405 [Chloroflexi bacterium]|nr:hypothetical protein [Chloroflexota bacterium]